MKRQFEPVRLGHDPASDEVGAAIRELRARRASATEIASLERRLSAQLAANLQSDVPASGATVGSRIDGWGGLIATLVFVAGAALIATVTFFSDSPSRPPVTAMDQPAREQNPKRQPSSAAAGARKVTQTLQPMAASTDGLSPIPAPTALPSAAVQAEPARSPSSGPTESRLRSVVRRPQRTAASESPTPTPATASSAEAELNLLQQAQAALEERPAATLALTDQHVRVYPRGVFVQEREILAIEALLKLARRTAALARARDFLVQYPTSAHVRRVRPLLEQAEAPTTQPSTDHP